MDYIFGNVVSVLNFLNVIIENTILRYIVKYVGMKYCICHL